MCTAISINGNLKMFGRTLDHDRSYGEKIIITPRNFKYKYVHKKESETGYAIIGVGCINKEIPL